jgi:hypothetical protein
MLETLLIMPKKHEIGQFPKSFRLALPPLTHYHDWAAIVRRLAVHGFLEDNTLFWIRGRKATEEIG